MIKVFVLGIILGGFYFSLLYWNISMLKKLKYPQIIFPLSFILRVVLLLGGIIYFSKGEFKNIIVLMGGVAVSKIISIIIVKRGISNVYRSK